MSSWYPFEMLLERIYDEDLAQAAWLVGCQETGEALIIDPQRDAHRYIKIAQDAGLTITGITETHIHADFLSGTAELAKATRATCYLSACGAPDWLYTWPEGSDANVVFVNDGDSIQIGNIKLEIMHTPGHTPEHISFLVFDKDTSDPIGIATGDFVFVGDMGRPDLLETTAGVVGAMKKSAKVLFQTCSKLKELPEFIQIWPGHGAGSACGKALGAVPQSTLGYEKKTSPPLQLIDDEDAFVTFMLSGQPEPPLYFERMKRMNRDGMPILGNLPNPKRIDTAEELLSLASVSTIIDTREWDVVRDGHLPNSIWSKANADFHRFAGSFIEDTENLVFIVTKENLERAILNAVRIGLDRIIGWAEPGTLEGMTGLETMPEVSSGELLALPHACVLDVRRLEEFSMGHIPNAQHIAHTRLLTCLKDLSKDQSWVVNCHGGSRSAAACMALKRKGYAVTNLAGGYKDWVAVNESCVVPR